MDWADTSMRGVLILVRPLTEKEGKYLNIIRADHVSFVAEEEEIIRGVSFVVEEGDCISLIGPSGSGKSTLLKVIADLIPLAKGSLQFKEKDYASYDPIELRRRISYCVQLPTLFGTTVYDNLEFPYRIRKDEPNRERMLELLERFGLDACILEKEITSLSGGEKQRVAIIRNLLYIPELLLLDEATSALDAQNARLVEAYVKELNEQGVTVLWITHSMEQSTGIFNKRITMESGTLRSLEVLK